MLVVNADFTGGTCFFKLGYKQDVSHHTSSLSLSCTSEAELRAQWWLYWALRPSQSDLAPLVMPTTTA